jgi:hypothetical protein
MSDEILQNEEWPEELDAILQMCRHINGRFPCTLSAGRILSGMAINGTFPIITICDDEMFDHSFVDNLNMKSSGKLSILRLIAWLKILVSTS